jgi:hypothetical protein
MTSAALALLGALVYGSADFFGGRAATRLRSIVVTAVAALSGLVVLAATQPFLGGVWTADDVAWGALAGVFGVVAVALLYACLAIGPMSILSPLTAVVSAIAPMLWGLLVNGEALAPIGYAGLGVALVAVVLVGFLPGEAVVRPQLRGVVMAVGAGIAIGAFLIVIDQTGDDSGLVPLVVSRATSSVVTACVVAVLVLVALRRGARARSVFDVAGLRLGASGSRRSCGIRNARQYSAGMVARDRVRGGGCRGQRPHAGGSASGRPVDRLGTDRPVPGGNHHPGCDRAA